MLSQQLLVPPADPLPPRDDIVTRFRQYLHNAGRSRILTVAGEHTYNLPYTTRYCSSYRRRQLRTLYGISDYINRYRVPYTTLLTLTAYQRYRSIGETFNALKYGWRKLSKRPR